MFDLTIGLSYNKSLKMYTKYRYDFVGFDLVPKYGNEPLNSSVFVFRTIKEGEIPGNVLIDLVDFSNVNAFDVALHGDAHIHILNINTLIEKDAFSIKDNITIHPIKNTTNNIEFQAIIKDQICRLNNDSKMQITLSLKEVNYLLFTKYLEEIVNIEKYSFPRVFELQRKHIWYQNRYCNFNDLSKLDIIKYNSEASSLPLNKALEIIKNNRDNWFKKQQDIFHELLEVVNTLKYFPIEK